MTQSLNTTYRKLVQILTSTKDLQDNHQVRNYGKPKSTGRNVATIALNYAKNFWNAWQTTLQGKTPNKIKIR
eukprot:14721979-Ditylum_brightwellii.AAC.1